MEAPERLSIPLQLLPAAPKWPSTVPTLQPPKITPQPLLQRQ